MGRLKSTISLASIGLLFTVACSADEDRPPGNESGTGQTARAGEGGSTAEDCIQIGRLLGQILTTDGEPPSKKIFTVCGSSCVYAELEEDGSFDREINHCYVPGFGYPEPVFVFHGEPVYGDFNIDFVQNGADVESQEFSQTLYAVPKSDASEFYDQELPFLFTTSDGFELEAEAGAMQIAFFHEEVTATRVDPEYFPLGVQEPPLFDVWYIGPDNSYVEIPMRVRFPNDSDLAPGAVVTLVALGNLGTVDVVDPGVAGVIGTATVTEDGTAIESDPVKGGSGLSTLGWVGLHVQP